MGKFFTGFVKVTGYVPYKLLLRTKIYYEDKNVQGRYIKGPAILVSNHKALLDFALYLFVFYKNYLRCQVAEVMFRNFLLKAFMNSLGAVYIDRNSRDFSFLKESEDILAGGGTLEIFPESRLPRKGEETPLEFKPSAAFLAAKTGVAVIPAYTNGKYIKGGRTEVIIGKPLYYRDYEDKNLSERENIAHFSEILRGKTVELGKELERQRKKEKR